MRKIINSRFGNLQSDNDFTYWSGSWRLSENTIGVTADFEDARFVPEEMPKKFEDFFVSLPARDENFRRAAAVNLLELFNGTWSDEENPPLSVEEFAKRIRIDGISFSEGKNTVEIYYDDNDLFAGHQIKVVAFYNGKVESASLP